MNNVISNYSKLASSYENTLGSSSQFLLPEIRSFYRNLPERSIVLDAGCGPGIEAEIGLGYGHSVMGLDLCPEMLKRYQSRNKDSKTILADISSIPMKESLIDAVFSSCVILHKNKTEGIKAIHEFFRILRPKGTLFLITSISNGIEELATQPALQTLGVNHLYFYHWVENELLDEIKLAGFEIEKLSQVKIKEGRPEVIIIRAEKRG